jgi:hypothetical protein
VDDQTISAEPAVRAAARAVVEAQRALANAQRDLDTAIEDAIQARMTARGTVPTLTEELA